MGSSTQRRFLSASGGQAQRALSVLQQPEQARLRHGWAKTTLDTYGQQRPDKDEPAMVIADSVFKARFEGPADSSRTAGGAP